MKPSFSDASPRLIAGAGGIRRLGLALAAVIPLCAFGQGTVVLNNRVLGITVSRVYAPEVLESYLQKIGNTTSEYPVGTQAYTGPALTGSGWVAGLWSASGADQPESALVPAVPQTTFRTGSAAGHVAATTATLLNVPQDAPVATLQLRVWPSTYSSWAEAETARIWTDVPMGKSPTFNVQAIGGGTNPAPNLLNLRSFSLTAGWYDLPAAPFIFTQPQSLTVSPGQDATFTVVAGGCCFRYYQWRSNAVDIPGANAASLTLSNVQPDFAASYSVLVTNGLGSALSSNATLTVQAPTPPTITQQPQPKNVVVGSSATFTVVAGGSAPLSYYWLRDSEPLAAPNAASLVLSNVQTNQAGNYSVIVSNAVGTTNSGTAALTVTVPGLAPSIVVQPQSAFATVGDNVFFWVSATGLQPLSYQWRLNGVKIPGATMTNLYIPNVQNVNFGRYTVQVTNAHGSQLSFSAELRYQGDGGGSITFNNRIPSSSISRVFGLDPVDPTLQLTGNTVTDLPAGTQVYSGTPLTGSNYIAQLWAAREANQPEGLLVPAYPFTTFRTGAAAGHVAPQTAFLPNVPGDYPIATVQLRVWDSRDGAISEWAQVLADPTVPRGLSPPFNLANIGGLLNVPPLLIGLQSFNLFIATNHAPVLDSPTLTADGFEFIVNDRLGAVYQIEVGGGQGGWSSMATVTNLYGKLPFTDPDRNGGARFYRAVRLQ